MSILLLAALQAAAAAPAPSPPSPGQIAAAAPAAEWRAIPADELLVMTLADGRRVVIQLAPRFAPRHVEAVRRIATARWWDAGATIYRVQDNYVAQWGDQSGKKPLPAGIADDLPPEYTVPLADPLIEPRARDAYAERTGFSADGWPLAVTGVRASIPHCYGMVGVGREVKPSTGSGAELYAVIGHAPRHLDRNIAVVGRVIDGIATLSALPRGTSAMGIYEDAAQNVAVRSIALASTLPKGERPRFEYLAPGGASFARYVRARENREPPFFEVPAGGVDICNVPVPVRPAAG